MTMFDNHSRINHVDDVILQVFEDSEDDGALYFPVTTQKEARAFVKALHAKGMAYGTICEEIVELEQNFTSWRTGLGRHGIGNRVIERINRPIQELLLADVIDDVSVEEELTAATVEQESTESCSNSTLERDESTDRQMAPRDTPTTTDASPRAVSLSHLDAGSSVDAVDSGHESTSAVDVLRLQNEWRDQTVISTGNSVAVDINHILPEMQQVVSNHVMAKDTPASGVRKEIAVDFLASSQVAADRVSSDIMNVESRETTTTVEPSSCETFTEVSVENGFTQPNDSNNEVDDVVVVAESEFVIECAVNPVETSSSCSSSSDILSIEMTSSTEQQHDDNELIIEDVICASVQLTATSISSNTSEHNGGESLAMSNGDGGAETGDIADRILKLQVSNNMTNGELTNGKSSLEEHGNDSKTLVDIDENYNSDSDYIIDDGCTTITTSRSCKGSKVDGPGYVYVFTDTVLGASSTASDYRVKIGASRNPYSRLRQAALFNVDIRLVSAVSVSARQAASQSVMDQLSAMALSDKTGWFVGRLDTVLDALMIVSRQFPVSVDSEC